MIFACCEELRLQQLRAHPTLNGIDFLEVLDRDAPNAGARQTTLLLHLVKSVPSAADLGLANVVIEGGERVRNLRVLWIAKAADFPDGLVPPGEQDFYRHVPNGDRVLVIRTDRVGDFSPYVLRLTLDKDEPEPLPGFDPAASQVRFSFKVDCPADLDCRPRDECEPQPAAEPPNQYLAKDYASFRRLILDRLSETVPQWRERSAADLGITLVELLAYVGDRLSYWQDAVATEAYLGTCRRRISMRRHARLVDYRMHEGCNARTWVHVDVDRDSVTVPASTPALSEIFPGRPVIAPTPEGEIPEEAALRNPVVFETVWPLVAWADHNEMYFYTWGEQRCCLARGATRATLDGAFPNLLPGDVLIFEERLGVLTGAKADADLRHRHAARLVEVRTTDAADAPLRDPLTQSLITEIRWDPRDALPYAVTVSTKIEGLGSVEKVTVVLGNNVLADHGQRVRDEVLPTVPHAQLFRSASEGSQPCTTRKRVPIAARYRPQLAHGPLTHQWLPDAWAPASLSLDGDARAAQPQILDLEGDEPTATETWERREDLLESGATDRHFVAEIADDGGAVLRFGNGVQGRRPPDKTIFTVEYRIGNGTAGNVGADALTHLVAGIGGVFKVRNPLPAVGGTDPEPLAQVRANAPHAFRRQERAVSSEDFRELCLRRPEIQRAVASFRWTGSWHTAFVAADHFTAAAGATPPLEELATWLDRFRMAGVDLAVERPHYVSLEIDMEVCVKAEYFRSHVKEALLDTLSSRAISRTRRGFFHADRFTFGQAVYLSEIYQAAQGVAGVESVRITRFRRQGSRDLKALQDGRIELDRLEIARLDNDPNYPEHGVLRLKLGGGK